MEFSKEDVDRTVEEVSRVLLENVFRLAGGDDAAVCHAASVCITRQLFQVSLCHMCADTFGLSERQIAMLIPTVQRELDKATKLSVQTAKDLLDKGHELEHN